MLGLGAGCLSTTAYGEVYSTNVGPPIEWKGDMMDWLRDVSSPFEVKQFLWQLNQHLLPTLLTLH